MDLNEEIELISERMAQAEKLSATHNTINVNGKVPTPALKIQIDRVVMLMKSEIAGLLIETLDGLMETYYNLPEDKQVKVLPDKVKYITRLGKELKEMEYKNNACKAMLINCEDKEIDDKLGAITIEGLVDIDLSDIEGLTVVSEKDEDEEFDIDEYDFSDLGIKVVEEAVVEEITSDIKEAFNAFKAKFKHDSGVARLQYESYPQGKERGKYRISNIFFNKEKWEAKCNEYKKDSTINYVSSEHYISSAKQPYYLIKIAL